MGPATGPMACWTSLFFSKSGIAFILQPIWVQQLDQWPTGQVCFSKLGSGLALQHIMGPAAGPMACWASLFFQIGERFNHPAHDGSSRWTNALLDKRVLPNLERFTVPAHDGPSSFGVCSSQSGGGLILQPTTDPATGPMACLTNLFSAIGAV